MGKNVAVFVDVANIFYAAKAAGVDIDYVLLLKAAAAGRDLVRAYAYTGLDPDNENQRNFHSFLARHDFRVVSKDIRKYGDGKVKANLDIELVVDMMKTARNLDVAVVVSGDGDFAPAIRAVQEMGVRVEVISFRGNTSSDLMDVADKFTDITQLAKVEKGSTVSGRRVASDDEDLSMTEVPDKLSEGTGRGRGRGRVRVEREPVATARTGVERAVRTPRTRRVEPIVADERGPVAEPDGQPEIVALPGEKLSKARVARVVAPVVVEDEETQDVEVVAADAAADALDTLETGGDGDAPRRRRRRGGRGRGRGRGQEGGVDAAADVPAEVREEVAAAAVADEPEFEVDDESIPAPRPMRPAAFGSIWDSQIGVKSPAAGRPAAEDEEFEDEPEIPEYLLAERRNRGGMGARGGQPIQGNRGNRARAGSYAAAIDRERYGRGGAPAGAGGVTRYGESSGRGGVNRDAQPRRDAAPRRDAPPRRDVSRPGQSRPERLEGRSGGNEPWSEVPPELEELLKAQLAQKLGRQVDARAAATEPVIESAPMEPIAASPDTSAPARGRGRRKAGAAAAPVAAVVDAGTTLDEAARVASPAPARRRRAAGASVPSTEPAPVSAPPVAAAPQVATAPEVASAPKRRAVRTKAAPTAGSTTAQTPVAEKAVPATPKRRTARTTAATASAATDTAPAVTDTSSVAPIGPAPKRRAPRKAAAPAEGA